MHARVLIVICVLFVSNGAYGHLFQRWLSRGQLPAPCQHAAATAATSQDEALPASALDIARFKVADDTGNIVMYLVETKKELFLFGEVPVPKTTPGTSTDTGAPSASTRAPAISTSVPSTSTSAPATSTNAPDMSTRVLATSTSAPATSTRMPTTSYSVTITKTSAPVTSTSAPITDTSAPTSGISTISTSSNGILPSSRIPPGYTYYSATGSYYKVYHEKEVTWDVANTTCESEGAYLVVLNNEEEALLVAGIVKDANQNYWMRTWLGLRRNRLGGLMDWSTVHGEPVSDVYHQWYNGKPYNNEMYMCAGLHSYYKLVSTYHCDDTLLFTCEISQ